jgi:hypothetical protein
MAATWCLTSEIAASKPELIHALLNGLQCRTYPPGVSIDWRDPSVQRSLDMQASTVTIVRGPRVSTDPLVFGLDRVTVGIKVLGGEVPSPPPAAADAPAAPPASPRRVSAGYQADRVDRGLDLLEDAGVELSDYTLPELRRLVLKRVPARSGISLPERQVLNKRIRLRLAK